MRSNLLRALWLACALFIASPGVAPLGAQPIAEKASTVAESAKVWPGHETEYEDFLRTAEVARIEEIPIGVMKPMRAYFKGNGLVESAAWKPIRPGLYSGYWESYKSEIAAYELDKLLGMSMVPVTVERKYDGATGAAVMWLKPVRMWKEAQGQQPSNNLWDNQVIRMKMFDNLIGNPDRNMGNLLVDPSWNLMLIDHSRAFIQDRKLRVPMTRVDSALWERMKALTEEGLIAHMDRWLGKAEIRAMLKRRDLMQAAIDKMVAERGAAAVFVQ